MCKNTHRYFGVNFLKKHLKRNGGSIILVVRLIFFSLLGLNSGSLLFFNPQLKLVELIITQLSLELHPKICY